MAEAVLSNVDLVHLILHHARLQPSTFVVASRVCKTWRAACLRDASLLIKAASECRYMTKQVVMGLFVLSNAEVNALPRTVWPRKESGLVYRYEPARVIVEALRLAGGVDGMKKRLLKRARYQASVEVAFGENWRELYLPRRGHVQITC